MQALPTGRSPFQEQSALSRNQRMLLLLIGVGSMLEFWDAYLIGFIMAFLIKPWGLTYGIMGTVLLASGAGAILGGVFWGWMADRHGRKPVFVGSLLVLAATSLGLAFTPDGGWIYMAVLRTVIGFCTAGYFIQIAMVNEFMPPKKRATLTGVVSAITTCGLLLGSFSGAYIIPAIGWRWTFALGAAPALIALIGAFWIPESPRWLALRGRKEEARRSVAWALGGQAPAEDIEAPAPAPAPRWGALFAFPRSVLTASLINVGLLAGYYGIVLWAPTLLAQVQSLGPADAAKLMIGFSVLGAISRLSAANLADRIGRRRTGGYFAIGGALVVLAAGFVGHGDLLTPSLFWLPLLVGFVLADGSFAVCAVYSTEIWPSHVRGSGAGFAGLMGSIGKIIGPAGLALVGGSGTTLTPKATIAVIVPAFEFLAACLLVCGLTYLFLGIEARGRTLESIDKDLDSSAKTNGGSGFPIGTASRKSLD
jgi:putative MFS transporter